MTAEIAIVNRSAVALAADSAVTIRIGGRYKIYDSAEKIFEFSRTQPIGLMLYNNVDFVGVPLDVLVRNYRNDHGKEYKTVKDAISSFLVYLQKFTHSVDDEKTYLFQVILPRFKDISNRHFGVFERVMGEVLQNKEPSAKPKESLLSIIGDLIAEEDEYSLKDYLKGVSLDEFRERYHDVVEYAANTAEILMHDDEDVKLRLIDFAFSIVKSSRRSQVFTGIVVGGFAEKELFPTLVNCEIDGVYFDQLKFLSGTELDIDRGGEKAAVVPFAQQEMAERFIYGLDANLQSEISRFTEEAVNQILDLKPNAFTETEGAKIKAKVAEKFEEMLSELKGEARDNILDVVTFMSKKEVAELAHALVELTSKKRRFSTEQETVGGPIDVAVITRNEGFIWIQRKHYFDAELNQNYLSRVNNQTKQGAQNVGSGQRKKGAKTGAAKSKKTGS